MVPQSHFTVEESMDGRGTGITEGDMGQQVEELGLEPRPSHLNFILFPMECDTVPCLKSLLSREDGYVGNNIRGYNQALNLSGIFIKFHPLLQVSPDLLPFQKLKFNAGKEFTPIVSGSSRKRSLEEQFVFQMRHKHRPSYSPSSNVLRRPK